MAQNGLEVFQGTICSLCSHLGGLGSLNGAMNNSGSEWDLLMAFNNTAVNVGCFMTVLTNTQ
eukprot:9719943-Lingulodinium_polyedra.AAC.1